MQHKEQVFPFGLMLLTGVLSLLLMAAGPSSRPTSRPATSAPVKKKLPPCVLSTLPKSMTPPPKSIGSTPAHVLFYTGGLRSYFEPCGCQADQLGGFQRLATLIESYRHKGQKMLLVDAGNLYFEALKVSPSKRTQNGLKASMIADMFKKMGFKVAGIGPHDLTFGRKTLKALVARSQLQTISSNLVDAKTRAPLFPTHAIVSFRGKKLGFLSVTATPPPPPVIPGKAPDKHKVFPKDFWKQRGLALLDPVKAARREVAALRKAGAQLIILLSTMGIPATSQLLAKVKGIHLAIDGHDDEEIDPPQRHGETFLLSTLKEGQKAGVMAMFLKGNVEKWAPIQTPDAVRAKIRSYRSQIATNLGQAKMMAAQGAAFKPIADVYRKQAKALQSKIKGLLKLAALPARLPEKGWGYVHALVPLAKQLLDCSYVNKRVATYQLEAKRANLEALRKIKPIPTDKHGNSFVGVDKCKTCHYSAYQFWKTTRHANAYATLVKKNKQFDLDCIGCHVVGWQKPGGLYDIQKPKRLANVQCENCHQAGAIHATKRPMKSTIHRKVPSTVCTGCHQGSHHPTFKYEVHVKKILGKGHGEKRLAELLQQEKLKK